MSSVTTEFIYRSQNLQAGNILSADNAREQIRSRGKEFFAKCKFVHEDDMKYDSKFATKVVYPAMGFGGNQTDEMKKAWWGRFGNDVKKAVETRRNGVVNEIKKTLMRK